MNLWMKSDTDLKVMMPYLSQYLGHKGPVETYYYYHQVQEIFETIRRKDKISSRVIPEVRYEKTDYDHLFFSRTRDFLDIYLSKQCSRSPYTVKTYRDALTVFRRYVTHQGISLKRFSFEDCTRDFMLSFMEYLLQEGYEKATCNQRLAAIKAYLWYVADENIDYQQTALAVSHVPFLKILRRLRKSFPRIV